MGADGKVFLRNERGQTAGPLDAAQVKALLDRGRLQGKILLSEDGVSFAAPGHFPTWRELFPQAMWGLEQQAAPKMAPVGAFEGELAERSGIWAYGQVAAAEQTGLLRFTLPDRWIVTVASP